ncbi:hypothetical protein DBR45_01745 [Pseudomonas sp. HMWF031]|nr:hypothetical protein DBR45_01745 [Pseudomonas sp. HMWF031]
MNGQRAVFERGILAQRPLLIRTPTRSKEHMNMPACLGRTRSLAGASLLAMNLRTPRGVRPPGVIVDQFRLAPTGIAFRQMGLGQSMKMCSRAKRRAR